MLLQYIVELWSRYNIVNRGGMGTEESRRAPMMHQNYTHTQDNQTQDIPREKNRRLKLNKYKVVISKSANHYIGAATSNRIKFADHFKKKWPIKRFFFVFFVFLLKPHLRHIFLKFCLASRSWYFRGKLSFGEPWKLQGYQKRNFQRENTQVGLAGKIGKLL
jgi:hypothetical protein